VPSLLSWAGATVSFFSSLLSVQKLAWPREQLRWLSGVTRLTRTGPGGFVLRARSMPKELARGDRYAPRRVEEEEEEEEEGREPNHSCHVAPVESPAFLQIRSASSLNRFITFIYSPAMRMLCSRFQPRRIWVVGLKQALH